jgi:hypothetical protein
MKLSRHTILKIVALLDALKDKKYVRFHKKHNHGYEPQSKLWKLFSQQAAGY